METVNKYVHAASNAIWGQEGTPNATQTAQQHGEEPISGVQGAGDATDPYDAGNREEQPGAPNSDGNTAPQEPNLGGKQQSYEEAALTSAPVQSTEPIIGGKQQSFEEAAVTSDPAPTKSVTTDTEDTSSSTAAAAAASNSTAQPISSGSTQINKETSPSEKEQRISSQSKDGESSETPRQAAHVDASKEALEGPQGPPLKTADEFAKESKGKKPDDAEKSPTSESKDSASKESGNSNESPTSSNKSEHSQESGKNSKLSKVKESVKKHLHHSSK